MASGCNRENTFKIDLRNFAKRPGYEAIHEFIYTKLKLSVEKVLKIQPNIANNCYYIKTLDLLTAQETVKNHDNVHSITVEGKRVQVHLVMEDGTVDVKLHDLSENVSNEQIVKYMRNYGEVLGVRNVVWSSKFIYKGIDTGAKLVKIILRHPIKSYVTIEGELTYVTHFGQTPTCRHCNKTIHTGFGCAQNRKLLLEKEDLNKRLERGDGSGSYSSVLQKSPTVLDPQEGVSGSSRDVELQNKNATQNTIVIPSDENGDEEVNLFKVPSLRDKKKMMDISDDDDEEEVTDTTRELRNRRIHSDGNQTDGSTTSTSSRQSKHRNPSKKKKEDTARAPGTENINVQPNKQ